MIRALFVLTTLILLAPAVHAQDESLSSEKGDPGEFVLSHPTHPSEVQDGIRTEAGSPLEASHTWLGPDHTVPLPIPVDPSGGSFTSLAYETESDSFDPAGPSPGLFATHGYNLDWEEGSWGVRGFYPLPLDAPVGLAGGIDYFPEDESNSLTAIGADLTYHLDMNLIGRGDAYGGFGPRYYRSSFDNGTVSSSSSEFGFGLVLGARVPVGPVSIYGDIGTDNIFDEWSCFTRVGVGLTFGDDE